MKSNFLLSLATDCTYHFNAEPSWQNTQLMLKLKFHQSKRNIFEYLHRERNFKMLLDLWMVDLGVSSKEVNGYSERFKVHYILENFDEKVRICLEFPCTDNTTLMSVAFLWKNAHWYEREIGDLFGFSFNDFSQKRLLLRAEFSGHPLRKDFIPADIVATNFSFNYPHKSTLSKFLVSPSHPQLQQACKIYSDFKDEFLHSTEVEIGFSHIGIEKILEQVTFAEGINLLDKFNGGPVPFYSTAWCMAIESYLQMEIPERAKAIRMLFIEWARIFDHLYSLSFATYENGAKSQYYKLNEMCALIKDYFIQWKNNQQQFALNCLGGVKKDLDADTLNAGKRLLITLSAQLNSICSILDVTPTWRDKLNVRILNMSMAMQWGITGPLLRACGVNYDLRKNHPIYFYQQMDFLVALGYSATCFDLYQVRIEEIRQSVSILQQLMNDLPAGEIVNRSTLPRLNSEIIRIKPSSGDYSYWLEGLQGAVGWSFTFNGGAAPLRARLRTPSFSHMQSLTHLLNGLNYADAKTLIAAFNISSAECDR